MIVHTCVPTRRTALAGSGEVGAPHAAWARRGARVRVRVTATRRMMMMFVGHEVVIIKALNFSCSSSPIETSTGKEAR